METDERAEAARLRYLGTDTPDALPWAELKERVKDTWRAVVEECDETHECVVATCPQCYRAHDAAVLRVPFSDAQIEAMTRAARAVLLPNEPITAAHWPMWQDAIRAALAAGGLVPCPVPEYKPEDVALNSRVPALEAEIAQLHIELDDKAFYVREFAAVSNERDAAKADLAGTERQLADCGMELIEAKAALRQAVDPDAWKTPKGLPSAHELAKMWMKKQECSPDERAEAILTALRPWLREPTGWECDISDAECILKMLEIKKSGTSPSSPVFRDFVLSRIRPTFGPCAMCAEWERDCRALSAASRSIDARIAARARGEGNGIESIRPERDCCHDGRGARHEAS